jgi:hypothetical protein
VKLRKKSGVQLTSGGFGTVYTLMPEAKKGVARIPVPPRNYPKADAPIGNDAITPDAPLAVPSSTGSAQMMISAGDQAKRDPWTVPLIGLLLAFSIISLIFQMLIAFG